MLIKELALRRGQHHHRAPRVGRHLQRFDRRDERLRLEHHPGAPAERPVVDDVVSIARPRPQVVNADLDDARLGRSPHDAVVERPRKEIGKDRYDVESHSSGQCSVFIGQHPIWPLTTDH